MTAIIRILIALTLIAVTGIGVYAGHTLGASAAVADATEIRILGEPVNGRLIHDAFGNTIGYEAFDELLPPADGIVVADLNGG